MSEELNHKTFDLIGVLSGRDYPTHDVTVFFNESLGFKIHSLKKDLDKATITDDKEEAKSIDGELEDLYGKVKDETYTVRLKAIPESLRRDIMTKINEEFPDETDLLGRTKPNPRADNEFTKKFWLAYIEYIKAPDGSQAFVDEKEVDALMNSAPISVHEAINNGIRELQTGAKSGFEAAAKEVDFLSIASPEG